jgi:hypothetical protein
MLAQVSSAADEFNARAERENWSTICDEKLSFDSPKLAELREVWRAVRGAREMPKREDFTARILGKHLQRLTFVECVRENGARRYRFRLFGSGLAQYIGDSTGKYLEEVVPETFIASWLATYDLVMETRKPMRFLSRFRASHLDHVAAECLVAPLAGEGSEPWGLMVSVVYSPVVI